MSVCGYCKHYLKSESIVKNRDIEKDCIPSGNKVNFKTLQCSYFNPSEHFFCNAYHERLKLLDCLPRRFNKLDLQKFDQCKDCQQFREEIEELITDYYINNKDINEPPRQYKLKYRRIKKNGRRLRIRRKKNN